MKNIGVGCAREGGRGSNSPPLMYGDQIPHPQQGKGVKCLGFARKKGGGGGGGREGC